MRRAVDSSRKQYPQYLEALPSRHKRAKSYKAIKQGSPQNEFENGNHSLLQTSMGIQREKELMAQEIWKLKQENITLREDLVRAKTEAFKQEKEMSQMVEKLQSNSKESDQQNVNAQRVLIQKVKAKYKQAKRHVEDTQRLLDELKKSVKHTTLQEVQIQMEQFKTETVRLRKLLSSEAHLKLILLEGKDKDVTFLRVPADTVQNLIKDNHSLFQKLKGLEVQLEERRKNEKDRIVTMNNSNSQQNFEFQRKVSELSSDNSSLRTRLNSVVEENVSLKLVNQKLLQKTDLTSVESQIGKMLQEQLKQKDEQIQQLTQFVEAQQKRIIEYQLAAKLQPIANPDQRLSSKNNTQENEVPLMKDIMYRKLNRPPSQRPASRKITLDQISYFNGNELDQQKKQEEPSLIEQKQSVPFTQAAPKKLKRVEYADVQQIGRLLRYRFMSAAIAFMEVSQLLMKESDMTLDEVYQGLQETPFKLGQQEALVLARYLTEDNSEEFVKFDKEEKQSAEIIISILRKVIGAYQLLSEDEKQEAEREIREVFVKFKQSLVETVKMFKQNGKSPEGVCLVTEFESALKYCDISFSARSSEYLQLVCYESLPEDILRMEYLNVLEHFS